MTHNSSHVIIGSGRKALTTTISTDPHSTTSKVRVWHVLAACLVTGFILGALV